MRRLFVLALSLTILLPLLAVLLAFAAATSQARCGGAIGPGDAPGVPANLLAIYEQAADTYQLAGAGWAYLAAINEIETSFGHNLSTSTAGATGWMQIIPTTWTQYEVAADPTKPGAPPDPNDPWDAIYTAARYLHAHRAPADWPAAIYAYNHADWYLTQVQQLAQHYAQTAGAGNTDLATDTAYAGGCITAGPTTPGTDARILPDGLAAAPLDAPEQVQAAIPAPASGSPCTPPPGTPSSTWPGSCSTPPTGQQRQPPRPAADRAGNPPRSSPPNSPTATHGPNATHRDSDTPPHRESAQAIAARHGVHPRDRIHRHATGPLPHGQARRRRGAHQPVDHHSPTDTKPWNH